MFQTSCIVVNLLTQKQLQFPTSLKHKRVIRGRYFTDLILITDPTAKDGRQEATYEAKSTFS
jgi:hypothetical protein